MARGHREPFLLHALLGITILQLSSSLADGAHVILLRATPTPAGAGLAAVPPPPEKRAPFPSATGGPPWQASGAECCRGYTTDGQVISIDLGICACGGGLKNASSTTTTQPSTNHKWRSKKLWTLLLVHLLLGLNLLENPSSSMSLLLQFLVVLYWSIAWLRHCSS